MTDYQKQCLLSYLGFDCGGIDGIWGEKSAAAAADFQEQYGLKADGIFGPVTEAKILSVICDGFWGSVRHFSKAEFACRCGRCGGFPAEPEERLVRLAEKVRTNFDAPVTVSSGVRCSGHNAAVGGVAGSRHLLGKAMDFAVKGRTAAEVMRYVNQLGGIRYAYVIDQYYIHMDIE